MFLPVLVRSRLVAVAVLSAATFAMTVSAKPSSASASGLAPEKMYVTDAGLQQVHVYQVRQGRPMKVNFITSIDVPDPWGVAVDQANGAFALVASTNGTLHRIDTATDTVTSTYDIGKDLRGVILTVDGKFAVIVDHKRKRLLVFDVARGKVIGEQKVKAKPLDIFRDQTGNVAMVSHLKKNFITAVFVDDLVAAATAKVAAAKAGPTFLVRKNIKPPKMRWRGGIVPSNPIDGDGKGMRMFVPDRRKGKRQAGRLQGMGGFTWTNLTLEDGGLEVATSLREGNLPGAYLDMFSHPLSSNQANECVVPAFTIGVWGIDLGDPVSVDDNIGTAPLFGGADANPLRSNIVGWGGEISVGDPNIDTFADGNGDGLGWRNTFGHATLPPGSLPKDLLDADYRNGVPITKNCIC